MGTEHLYEYLKYAIYLIVIAAFLMRRGLYLRILVIIASILGILFFYGSLKISTSWVDIAWLSSLIIINAGSILLFFKSRNIIDFRDENERMIYEKAFRHLNNTQFRKLIEEGEFISADAGEVLTELGKPVLHLIMLCKGQARVVVNGQTIAYSHPGNLIGEMSFISHSPASATVYIIEPSIYIQWPQDKLRALLESDPELNLAMQTVFNVDHFRKYNVISSTLGHIGKSGK